MHKGKFTNKLIELRKRHDLSLKIPDELVSKTENGWNVISTSEIQEMYFVQQSDIYCKCQLTCLECKSCIHNYTCTCIDSSIKWNMCKHIHLICRVKSRNTCNNSEDVILQNDDDPTLHMHITDQNKESDVLVSELSKNNSPASNINLSLKKEKLKQKIISIIDSISSESQFVAAERLISPIEPTLNAIITSTNCSLTSQDNLKKVPANKNITCQRPLYSTHRIRKKPKNSIVKPNHIEQQNIALSLILNKNSNSKEENDI